MNAWSRVWLGCSVVLTMAASACSAPHSLPEAAPTPNPSVTPSPDGSAASTTPTSMPAPTGPYDVVLLRGTTLVALDSTGVERWSRDLAEAGMKRADLQYAYVSSAGWVSVETTTSMSVFDLKDPSLTRRTLRGSFDTRAWSPDGRLLACLFHPRDEDASTARSDAAVIDPATLAVTDVLAFTGGGPDPAWTLDSASLLWQNDTNEPEDPGSETALYSIRSVADGTIRTDVPPLAFRARRSVTVGGLSLSFAPSPGEPQTVVATSNDGSATPWYQSDLSPDTVVDASFTADGTAAWLLLSRASGTPALILARTDGTGGASIVSTVDVDSNKWNFFQSLAPDDSMVVAGSVTHPNAKNPTFNGYLLATDGAPGIHLAGDFVGWIPDSLVDQLPG